ncbi:MAG: hypothetical protein J5819_09210 [Eubacterium sp.]|nr:hypothetical protein [Eubacterium sp.]
MTNHKYLFWITEAGIQTFRYNSKGGLNLIPYKGEKILEGTYEINEFFNWFRGQASIATDEYVDLCWIATKPLDPEFLDLASTLNREAGVYSSWDKTEINGFLRDYVSLGNYRIIMDNGGSFMLQTGDIYDENDVIELYLLCVPEFSCQDEIKDVETSTGENSILSQCITDFLEKTRNWCVENRRVD